MNATHTQFPQNCLPSLSPSSLPSRDLAKCNARRCKKYIMYFKIIITKMSRKKEEEKRHTYTNDRIAHSAQLYTTCTAFWSVINSINKGFLIQQQQWQQRENRKSRSHLHKTNKMVRTKTATKYNKKNIFQQQRAPVECKQQKHRRRR